MAYTLTVELALGADLTAAPFTWVWTDVTRYVHSPEAITITRGRADEFSSSAPDRATLTLINDGRFVPRNPNGAYYGSIGRNTPLRVRVNGTARFWGYVDEWPTTWADSSTTVSLAPITASGLLRRLGQGAVLQSAMYRSYVTANPLEYWPMEDATAAQQSVSAVGGAVMTSFGRIRFGTETGPAGSKPLPDFTLGGSMRSVVRASTSTTWRAECSVLVNVLTTGLVGIPLDVYTGGGVQMWELVIPATVDSSTIYVRWTFPDGSTGVAASGIAGDDGAWHHLRLDVTKAGSAITYALYVDGLATPAAGTLSLTAFGGVTSVVVAPAALPSRNPVSAGHVLIWDAAPSIDTYQAFAGWSGENATDRWTRLGTENALPFTTTAFGGIEMGPQQSSTLLGLLREAETTDQGIVYDGLNGLLTLRPHNDRYNQPVSLTLDVRRGHVSWPFVGTDDDQQLHNDVTASGPTGSSARYVVTAGTNGTAAVGTYQDTIAANVSSDTQLAGLAQWRAHLGTVEDLRYPTLTINLVATPALITPWLSCDIGERIAVTGLSKLPVLPADDLDLHLEGYTERIDNFSWTATLNTGPARPWQVMVLDATGNSGRLDTGISTLNATVTASAVSLSVATASGPLWPTGATSFDVGIDGERMTVTNISGSSSPQTFTVTRAVNGISRPHTATASVTLWRAGVMAL